MKSFNETGLSRSWQAAWFLFVLSKSDPSPSRLLSIAASPINALHQPPSCIPQWQPIPWLPAVTSSHHDPSPLAHLFSVREISFGCVSFLRVSVAVANGAQSYTSGYHHLCLCISSCQCSHTHRGTYCSLLVRLYVW